MAAESSTRVWACSGSGVPLDSQRPLRTPFGLLGLLRNLVVDFEVPWPHLDFQLGAANLTGRLRIRFAAVLHSEWFNFLLLEIVARLAEVIALAIATLYLAASVGTTHRWPL